MAQSITLWGATYQNVGGVDLPRSPSGTARFTDVTDTTADASDVVAGNYFYLADGTRTQGTIASKSSADLSANGATVTAPAGFYSTNASLAVSSGSVTAPSTISGSSATVSTGTNTLTLSKTVSVTPSVTTAGYISSGTAGNADVSLTASVTTKGATTYTPTTSNQTIASGTYLTGTQTISGDANLVASNIKSGVSIFGVSGSLAFVTYYTGSSAPSSSLGSNGDIYLQS